MNRYLLDTNICVFLFRRKYGIAEKLQKIGAVQCVTIAELKYGAYKSDRIKENLDLIERFVKQINIVQKSRLCSLGLSIGDLIC